ncbi:MAG: dihydroorotase [Cytophagales bacterium]|nr:dihydroorotase [Cytophagales bacterium]
MKILLKAVTILDKNSKYHGKKQSVLVDKGKIVSIGKAVDADKVISVKGGILTPGWFDMNALFGDPGFEHRESLASGVEAAVAGGFTGVALMPNNAPVTQGKNQVSYLTSVNTHSIAQVYPVAAVTVDTQGTDLTEMIDLHTAGAVAFSDGDKPLWHADVFLKALQYLQKFDGLLIDRPEDIHLNRFGVMNEGPESTLLGMKGMPNLAEEIIVRRNLELLEYAGGRLHLTGISTSRSLDMIKSAKKKGLAVTCDMTSYQVSYEDTALDDFDTNLKVNPPFRSKKDNASLVKGLREGIIDVITSGHRPYDEESKKLEFDLAEFGITSLQTVAHNLVELSGKVEMEDVMDKITRVPRELLGIAPPVIEAGNPAELTLLDPNREWTLNTETNRSQSANSPYWGQLLKGKVVAVFNHGREYIDA